MKPFKKSLTIFLLFSTSCASLSWAQPFRKFSSFLNSDCARLEMRDHEFANSGDSNGNFYCNPLMISGAPSSFRSFTLKSKGELTLIKGDAKSGEAVEIPFYLHLRRKGKLVTPAASDGVIFSKAEISIILKVALKGDELIIEPVNKEDWPAKRIITIEADGC
jgi:hypothetical protein